MDKFLPYFAEMIENMDKLANKYITEEQYKQISNDSLTKFSKTWELKDMREIKKIGEIAGMTDPEFKATFDKVYFKRLSELVG
jgi:hypothetical protein